MRATCKWCGEDLGYERQAGDGPDCCGKKECIRKLCRIMEGEEDENRYRAESPKNSPLYFGREEYVDKSIWAVHARAAPRGGVMITYKRICIKDYTVAGENGRQLVLLKRGKEYLTSVEQDLEVTVFTNYWVSVPVAIFAGEILFTDE